jgi:hypothetical protein
MPSNFAVLPRSLAIAVDRSAADSVKLIDLFPAIAMSNEFRLELVRHGINSVSVPGKETRELPCHRSWRDFDPTSSKPLPYPSVGILMWTGENREDVVQDLSPAIH